MSTNRMLLVGTKLPPPRYPNETEPPAGRSESKPQLPPLTAQAWSLTKSLAAFVADGFGIVTKEEYTRRLSICDPCAERTDSGRCAACGCPDRHGPVPAPSTVQP